MAKLLLKFQTTDIAWIKATDGKMIAVFALKEPIAEVKGSLITVWPQETVAISVTDVNEIRIHEDNFDQIEYDTDTKMIFCYGLMLDVARRTGQVWLVKKSFTDASNEWRNKRRTETLQSLIKEWQNRSKPVTWDRLEVMVILEQYTAHVKYWGPKARTIVEWMDKNYPAK